MFDHVFRLNPNYTLTSFENLPEKYRKKFEFLKERKGFYGLLHAHRDARLPVKAVNRDFALFLEKLKAPVVLKDLFPDPAARKQQERFIIRQVMDHVLEVQDGERFAAGIEAVNRVLLKQKSIPRLTEDESPRTPIQKLSERAIRFAMKSPMIQPMDLSFLLYRFNRLPVSLRWQRRMPDEPSTLAFLDLEEDGSWEGMPGTVKPKPLRLTGNPEHDLFEQYWRVWNLADQTANREAATYKVYFSPVPDDLPAVFKHVRQEVAHSGAHAMKTARTLPGFLRSDKLFVYFKAYDDALGFAHRTAPGLKSYRVHGVPFTHQVDPENPVVSLGVDPPPRLIERGSWRSYLADKLALCLVNIQRTRPDDPMGYLHAYMKMIDVDSRRWCPLARDWRLEFKIEKGPQE